MKTIIDTFLFDVMGIKKEEQNSSSSNDKSAELVEMLIGMRKQAKSNKDFATADLLRDELAKLNIILKDGPEGTTWSVN